MLTEDSCNLFSQNYPGNYYIKIIQLNGIVAKKTHISADFTLGGTGFNFFFVHSHARPRTLAVFLSSSIIVFNSLSSSFSHRLMSSSSTYIVGLFQRLHCLGNKIGN